MSANGGGGRKKMGSGGNRKRSAAANNSVCSSKTPPKKRSSIMTLTTANNGSISCGKQNSDQSVIPLLDSLVVIELANQMTTLGRLQLAPVSRLFVEGRRKSDRNDVALVLATDDSGSDPIVRLTLRDRFRRNSEGKSVRVKHKVERRHFPAFFAKIFKQVKRLWAIKIDQSRYGICDGPIPDRSGYDAVCKALDDHRITRLPHLHLTNTNWLWQRLIGRYSACLRVVQVESWKLQIGAGFFVALGKCPSLRRLVVSSYVFDEADNAAFFNFLTGSADGSKLRSITLDTNALFSDQLTPIPAAAFHPSMRLHHLTISQFWLHNLLLLPACAELFSELKTIRLVLNDSWEQNTGWEPTKVTQAQALRKSLGIILQSTASNAQLTVVYSPPDAAGRLKSTTFDDLFDGYLKLSSRHRKLIKLELGARTTFAKVAECLLNGFIGAHLKKKFAGLRVEANGNSVLIRRRIGRIQLCKSRSIMTVS